MNVDINKNRCIRMTRSTTISYKLKDRGRIHFNNKPLEIVGHGNLETAHNPPHFRLHNLTATQVGSETNDISPQVIPKYSTARRTILVSEKEAINIKLNFILMRREPADKQLAYCAFASNAHS
ncbi:hypothetical protein AAHE18_12G061300 [Arachis hypogaea]